MVALACLPLQSKQPAHANSPTPQWQVQGEASPNLQPTAYAPATPQQWKLNVDATNRSRADNQLVLYTPAYGTSTRTNPYGVEAVAETVGQTPSGLPLYQVMQTSNVWACMKANSLASCGNANIPAKGVVLSASGNRRLAVQEKLPVGARFSLQPAYFTQGQATLDITDPTEATNPKGRTYPGLRASQQLLRYTPAYGQPTTGTNEYGYEVTVVDGRVVREDGANSPIPPNGYVLSGHGRSREWLIANAPLGASITLETQGSATVVKAKVDVEAYRSGVVQGLQALQALGVSSATLAPLQAQLAQADALAQANQSRQAVDALLALAPQVNRVRWQQQARYPQGAVKAVWHRPVESTPQAVAQTLDRLQQAGLNTVFLESFYHGYPLWASQVYQQYGIAANQHPMAKGQPMLTWWLDAAHQRGMKVHLWFQTFYAGNTAIEGVGPILQRYPQWANVQRVALNPDTLTTSTPKPSNLELGHYFLDPANPEVRSFLLALLAEAVTRYPVDGVQLDYIRYPNSFPPERTSYVATTWGYTPVARAAFAQQTGGLEAAELDPYTQPEAWQAWNTFKANQVTTFVQQATTQLNALAAKRGQPLVLSAAVFPRPEEAFALKHQHWASWQQQGLLKFLAPMSLTGSATAVGSNVAIMSQQLPMQNKGLVSGVFGPFNNLSANRMMEQLEASRLAGATGYALFDSAHLTGEMLEALAVWQGTPEAR